MITYEYKLYRTKRTVYLTNILRRGIYELTSESETTEAMAEGHPAQALHA